jgi:3D (Asp-Asp-Asp) domain-containing protein/peptidoglycan hydrolase CwlO-like protein
VLAQSPTWVTVHAVVAPRLRSRTGRLVGLALALGLVAVSSALASQTAHRTGTGSARASREQQALFELYALDSRLQASQARVTYLAAEAAKLRRERRALRSELRADRAMLVAAQTQLALQLRTLYERGEVDPLAVVFGATSLGKALQALDALRRSAAENGRIVTATRAAARRVSHAQRTLTADARRLARSLVSARAAARSLASTAASKSAYVASLRSGANAAATAGLLSSAGSAAKKSQKIGHGHSPPPQPPPKGGRKMTVSATCYILKGTTASGLPAGPGVVAVDPTVIPLGTRLYIPGYGKGIAADIGGGIKGKIIDLWYSTYAQCAKWGRRTVTITLY